MVIWQHRIHGFSHEHTATTPIVVPGTKTLTPSHPRPAAIQENRRLERPRLSHPWPAQAQIPDRAAQMLASSTRPVAPSERLVRS